MYPKNEMSLDDAQYNGHCARKTESQEVIKQGMTTSAGKKIACCKRLGVRDNNNSKFYTTQKSVADEVYTGSVMYIGWS